MGKVLKNNIIFVAGIYGVGKDYLVSKVSSKFDIIKYSARDIISQAIGEKYGSNKYVTDKNANQEALVEFFESYDNDKLVLLTGHFCILDKNNDVVKLPEYAYNKLRIKHIICFNAEIGIIQNHLINRDGKIYDLDVLDKLQKEELNFSYDIAKNNNIKYTIFDNYFKEEDVLRFENIIIGDIS